jgi:hypothetical protein
MDNASKNATDMISRLQMQYNRGRQAAITNELVDIITGLCSVYSTYRACAHFNLQVPVLSRLLFCPCHLYIKYYFIRGIHLLLHAIISCCSEDRGVSVIK